MTARCCPLPEDDDALLARALGAGAAPASGDALFAPDSWLRRVSGESAVLFGGGCALLLEVAHPLVAAGVVEHSRYREDPFGRLGRTLAAMNAMAFGSVGEALAAARGVERAHHRVRGTLRVEAGPWPAGTPYDGRDPDLVRWVWATLAWTAREVYARVVGPLDPAAEHAYFAEHAVLARLLGVPPEAVPETPAAFDRYFDDMVTGGALHVGEEARDVARFVLEPPPGVRALMGSRVQALTGLLLPEPMREAYAIPLDEARRERTLAWLEGVRESRRAVAGGR